MGVHLQVEIQTFSLKILKFFSFPNKLTSTSFLAVFSTRSFLY